MTHVPTRVYPTDLLGWRIEELLSLAAILAAVLLVLVLIRRR